MAKSTKKSSKAGPVKCVALKAFTWLSVGYRRGAELEMDAETFAVHARLDLVEAVSAKPAGGEVSDAEDLAEDPAEDDAAE